MANDIKMMAQPPIFPMHTQPEGRLPQRLEAQACWYYYMIAQTVKEKTGQSSEDQIILEGELWKRRNYIQQKLSISKVYGVSPDDMDKHWPDVNAEVQRINFTKDEACGLPIPSADYMYVSPVFKGMDESKE